MAKTARTTISCGFGSLMDIDKLIHYSLDTDSRLRFGSLMDIDKLILCSPYSPAQKCFGSLMDIDKLIHQYIKKSPSAVLVL